MAFGTYLRQKCDAEGWSIEELSRQSDIPIKTLRNILYNDSISVRKATIEKLGAVLDMSDIGAAYAPERVTKADTKRKEDLIDRIDSIIAELEILKQEIKGTPRERRRSEIRKD